MSDTVHRRDLLKLSAGLAATIPLASMAAMSAQAPAPARATGVPADHDRRMAWWRAAKFGMFVTWGPPSIYQRGDWVTGIEDIPPAEYERACASWRPAPGAARAWARLAKAAGMRYMVLVTKHHDGYCLFDSKLTDFCATKLGPKRDLVREYVEAARAEGLRVGIYYSLMDWHHPDGMASQHDPAARERFVAYTHGQLRELMSNYGKIDILWYDVAVPLDAGGWRSKEMNAMVFGLQPDIVVNNRNWLPGDFDTPEQAITSSERDWESCMTLNGTWNIMRGDDTWKNARQVVQNLTKCVQDGGNYILNIGPTADGTVPPESTRILREVGAWLRRNGEAVYGAQRSQVRWSMAETFSRKNDTLYINSLFPTDGTLIIGGIRERPLRAWLLATGKPVRFEQVGSQLRFPELPVSPDGMTTVAAEFAAFPEQSSTASRAASRLHELYKETGITY